MNLQQLITNALYAQAVCDAVGNPFEFQTNINPKMVVSYANEAKSLVISDDTQMAMFGVEAIANMKEYVGDFSDILEISFTESYLNWNVTQTQMPWTIGEYSDGLLSFPEMWSVQSPGGTCLSALDTISHGKEVKNDSKGCGSVMRLLPLVCLYAAEYKRSHDEIVEIAKMTGAITHLHVENDLAIEYYMNTVEAVLAGLAFSSEFDEVENISEIGDGWTALEAVQMAVWAYCKAESFDHLLELSIAHDGDSDSVGAIAGSLWGLSGLEVPQKYIDKLDALKPIKYIIDEIITK